MKKILLGTHNQGKIVRYKKLLAGTGLDLEVLSPDAVGLESIDAEETGKTLAENAEIKARAYFGKTDVSILANDTGIWVDGEGLVDAPKRIALGGADEKGLTKEEIAHAVLEFWKGIARAHGGRVDAAWVEAFVLLDPDGRVHRSESRREIILTDQMFGEAHIQMPVRALYISKATDKPSLQHTAEEEELEMRPIVDALVRILAE
jgi:inosine/xanthosine triphosphate pyrophosphatase family protein